VPYLLGPRFFRSHQMDHPIQSPLTTYKGMWKIYSNQYPHPFLCLVSIKIVKLITVRHLNHSITIFYTWFGVMILTAVGNISCRG
jgi:hypothetical protein